MEAGRQGPGWEIVRDVIDDDAAHHR